MTLTTIMIIIYFTSCSLWALYILRRDKMANKEPFNSLRHCINDAVINFIIFPIAFPLFINRLIKVIKYRNSKKS